MSKLLIRSTTRGIEIEDAPQDVFFTFEVLAAVAPEFVQIGGDSIIVRGTNETVRYATYHMEQRGVWANLEARWPTSS